MKARFDQMNMIPFIDIMLVLLAIVLTTASFVSMGLIDVNLPVAEQYSEVSSEREVLEIALNAERILYFQGEELSLSDLDEQLANLPADHFLVLRIDKSVPFEQFIELVDLLKTHSLANLSIQVLKGS